ncbi:MAG: D-TA family PLP-dependent enzyme [Lachnospiraceae bacterium]|jgi:D-serine deaminase-like pyridoxal phosphate-dependent protein|nr:D-TA family PLP-dependent enzyme [Lachnospiraceae bacterium]
MAHTYSFQKSGSLHSPALIYYRDIIASNIQKAINAAQGAEHLWPHIKSHKMADVIRMSMTFGITHFKCATISEAETAASCHTPHIMLAYPLVGPNISRFIQLAEAFPQTHFYAIGDNLEMLSYLGKEASTSASLKNIDVFIDINTGMNRTGVPLSSVNDFYNSCLSINGISIVGIHCYDGNRTESDCVERKKEVTAFNSELRNLIQSMREKNSNSFILVIGGSPSFHCHTSFWLTENVTPSNTLLYFSPGTIFIYDYGYQKKYPDLPYIPAASILTRVISHPSDGIFTLDCGYKSIAADPTGSRGMLLGVSHYEEMFQSEEHWTFRMKSGFERERPPIGKELFIIPTHICPTSALYPEAIVIEKGEVIPSWPVSARNRKITY